MDYYLLINQLKVSFWTWLHGLASLAEADQPVPAECREGVEPCGGVMASSQTNLPTVCIFIKSAITERT